jgi:hypothetical protein
MAHDLRKIKTELGMAAKNAESVKEDSCLAMFHSFRKLHKTTLLIYTEVHPSNTRVQND